MNKEPNPYQWAVPEGLNLPSDPLEIRLDFYHNAIVMYTLESGIINTRVVSAIDIARALMRDIPYSSGLLPQDTLWWTSTADGPIVALWRNAQPWKVALVAKELAEPRRFVLPMPGLIFLCQSGLTPSVYAARKRPVSGRERVYHAPLFNVFQNGRTCRGSHQFPANVSQIPESFFLSFFSAEGHPQGRSRKHGADLLKLWEQIDGKKKYPLSDLVEFGYVEDLLNVSSRVSY